MNSITFNSNELEEFIIDELPAYVKESTELSGLLLAYQDNINREEITFPCFAFELYSSGADKSKIDSDNIENATGIMLDLDLYVDKNVAIDETLRHKANIISFVIARFINEKLGLRITQNDRVPSTYEGILRKKIRAIGKIDNTEYIIYTD